MDKESKKIALDKAKTMMNFVIYPDEYLDDEKMTNYYEGLEIYKDNLLQSFYNINYFPLQSWLANYGKLYDRNEWSNYGRITGVYADYLPFRNVLRKFIYINTINNTRVLKRQIYFRNTSWYCQGSIFP